MSAYEAYRELASVFSSFEFLFDCIPSLFMNQRLTSLSLIFKVEREITENVLSLIRTAGDFIHQGREVQVI